MLNKKSCLLFSKAFFQTKSFTPFNVSFSTFNKTHYDILGVTNRASHQEIKKAFYVLAKKYHPDVSSENASSETFKEINQAYEILGDKEKRKKYDESLQNEDYEFESGTYEANEEYRSSKRRGSSQYEWSYERANGNWEYYEYERNYKRNGEGNNEKEGIINPRAIIVCLGLLTCLNSFLWRTYRNDANETYGGGSEEEGGYPNKRRCPRLMKENEKNGGFNLGKGMGQISRPNYFGENGVQRF